jgi:hypothetical protein
VEEGESGGEEEVVAVGRSIASRAGMSQREEKKRGWRRCEKVSKREYFVSRPLIVAVRAHYDTI